MFTGLIEEIGIVKSINNKDLGSVITISCEKILKDIKIGDSIAINGACQTVTAFDKTSFSVECMPESLKLTNLKEFSTGSKVNLERAMLVGSRFGGHFVSGHIEGLAKFLRKEKQGMAEIFYFQTSEFLEKYMVYKGSITVNGISLTIAYLSGNIFSVSVIPQTIQETNLKFLQIGDNVNIETDIIAKYVEKLITKSDNNTKDISLDFLKDNGFY